MKAYLSGRDLIIEDATNENILGGSFRNFAGEMRKDRNTGRIVNDAGKRNFNLRIDEALVPFFMDELGCNVKSFGDEEDKIYFVKVNVNTQTSKRPPIIETKTRSSRPTELPVDKYHKLDSYYFDDAMLVIALYKAFETPTLYLNHAMFTLKMDPITEKFGEIIDANNIDPNAPDARFDDALTEEVPFN